MNDISAQDFEKMANIKNRQRMETMKTSSRAIAQPSTEKPKPPPPAFANASLDFPGEIGNCVSAKTSNLGKDKLFTSPKGGNCKYLCRFLRFLANHRFA